MLFSALAVSAGFWPTFLYNDVCLGFLQSAVLLDDFITTENDVWGNKRKSRFRLDEPELREKNKGHTIVMQVFYEIMLRS